MEQTFPAWLQAHLDASGVGVAEFARRLGVSQSMVSNYLNDKQRPERKTIRRLAAGLGVAPAEIVAILDAEEAQRRGAHVGGLGPTGQPDLLREGAEAVYATGAATVRIDDPRLVGYFYGFLSRWERMTEEERESLLADEVDIPEPPAARGEAGEGGGGERARGPG